MPRLPEAMLRRVLEVDGRRHLAVVATVRTRAPAIRRIPATSCGAERQHTLLDQQQEPALVLLEDLALAAFAPAGRTSPEPVEALVTSARAGSRVARGQR